jgi:hypothetical protein
VATVAGDDFRITTADGTTIDVDADGLTTMQDLITRLNTLGGRAITAGLANQGNGVQITDGTVGAGTLTIEALNASPALEGLGLNVTATGNQLVGRAFFVYWPAGYRISWIPNIGLVPNFGQIRWIR